MTIGAEVVQTAVDRWLAAGRRGDRVAYDQWVSARDPSFVEQARLLYTNLAGLPLSACAIRLEPRRWVLDGSRAKLFGADAWLQRARVSWRLPGEAAMATHLVWLTLVADAGQVRIAGTLDRPAGQAIAAAPLWWVEAVRAVRQGQVNVLLGPGQPESTWLPLAVTARRDVRRRLPPALTWDGPAVLEVPGSPAAFAAVLGSAATDAGTRNTAAVTRPEGLDLRAATRVIVNPEARTKLTTSGLSVTVTHELVHVATRSADSRAPLWAVEGLAEWVALDAHPEARAAATRRLFTAVRAGRPPSALPADPGFDPARPDVDLAYAEAYLACRYVAGDFSRAALGRLYAELDAGRSLDQASRTVLGVTAAQFTLRWRDAVAAAAGSAR